MAPDERREVLVDVYLQLARAHGRRPSTSEIAAAAKVAEGTIYRAFRTKDELEEEAVQFAFCPAPVRHEIAAIDPGLSMRDRLVAFTRILQQRFTDVFGLMTALGIAPPARDGHDACFAAGHHLPDAGGSDECSPRHQPLLDAITELLEGSREQFAVAPEDVIHRIRLLTFSGSHPAISDGRLLTPEEIVDTILDGVRIRTTVGGARQDADSHRAHRNPVDLHAGSAPNVATEAVGEVRPDLIREGS
jgi:AcrR family transcriptional regulator